MKSRIDLLLTDVVMPGMSGAQLASAMRASHPEVRVLLMSGHPDERVARHTEGPRFPMLRKPFNAQDLLEAVRRTLDAAGFG
ncbi:MAG: response regulator [Myxococcota bacterium]